MIDKVNLYNEYFKNSRGEVNAPPVGIVPVEIDETDVTDFTSLDNIDDIDRLVELIRDILERSWGDECPLLVDQYPTNIDPKDIKMPMIVYDYYDRKYAENTKNGPQLMKTIKKGNDSYELLSEWYNCKLQFDICHLNTRAAKILAKKFEIFMSTYMQYFKYIGVTNIKFNSEPKSTPYALTNMNFPKRVLIYDVKLERRYIRRQGEALSTIDIVLKIINNTCSDKLPGVYQEFGNNLTVVDPTTMRPIK